MTDATNKQTPCDQPHPSHRKWMIDTSDPRTARFLVPLSNLNADFWESWNAEDVACAMAYFAIDTLRTLHASDPNYDEDMARDQCMLAARHTVFDYAGMLTEADYQQMQVGWGQTIRLGRHEQKTEAACSARSHKAPGAILPRNGRGDETL